MIAHRIEQCLIQDKTNQLHYISAMIAGLPEESSRRAKSSIDLSSAPGDPHVTSPPLASKRRFWSSFRNKTKNLRHRQKNKSKEEVDTGLSVSQPEINSNRFSYDDDIPNSGGSNDFDHLFRCVFIPKIQSSSPTSYSFVLGKLHGGFFLWNVFELLILGKFSKFQRSVISTLSYRIPISTWQGYFNQPVTLVMMISMHGVYFESRGR